MPFFASSFLLLVLLLLPFVTSNFLLLVVKPFVTSDFLLLVVMPLLLVFSCY